MNIEKAEEGGRIIIKLTGRMDASNAEQFDRYCAEVLEQGVNRFVLDLGELEYVSSAGLRSLLTISRLISSTGGKMALAGAKGIVNDVLVMSGFSTFLLMCETREKAIASLS